jgi:DNA-binding CsgD family transcriptional regulator
MIVFTLKHGTVIAFVTALQVWAAREDPIKRAFIRRFSAVYLAGYLFFQLSIADIIPVYTTPFPDHLIAAIQICFHFPVLAVMNRYLELRARNRTPEVERTGFADLLAGLGLSAREAEIVGLVSQGYSNKEIEDELFISLATVKKHLFNVFKKLKVKNRVQLTNFIQNATTGSTVGHEKKMPPRPRDDHHSFFCQRIGSAELLALALK